MITFRHVEEADYPLIGRWLSNPHVARWWNQEFSPDALARDFGPVIRGEEPAENLLALEDGTPFAHLQRCRWADYPEDLEPLSKYVEVPDGALTIDYLIGEQSQIGRGLGTSMITAFVADTWDAYPPSDAIIVPVNARNPASWRALEKAGFRIVREAELEPDNPIDPPLHTVLRLDRK